MAVLWQRQRTSATTFSVDLAGWLYEIGILAAAMEIAKSIFSVWLLQIIHLRTSFVSSELCRL